MGGVRTSDLSHEEIAIASGQTTSGEIDLGAGLLCSVYAPANFTGTSLKVKGSYDGIAYFPVYNNGSEYAISVSAGQSAIVNSPDLAGYDRIKLEASSQASDVTLQLGIRSIL
jgi:hypothetical protein